MLIIIAEVWRPNVAPFLNGEEPKLGPFAARSGVHRHDSVSSPSAQVKAAFVQVGHCNWNWKNTIFSPTVEVRRSKIQS